MTESDLHRAEWIAERAGIREFDANMPRDIAEVMARQDWLRYVKDSGKSE
jgi:hypothetical protein